MAHRTQVEMVQCFIGGGTAKVGGTSYEIEKGRTTVDVTGYDIPFISALEDLQVGSIVVVSVDGNPVEFIVVHQGNPDPDRYDDTCNGTWLLMKDIYSTRSCPSLNGTFSTQLNDDLFPIFDEGVQDRVKKANIPTYGRVDQTVENPDGVEYYTDECHLFLLSPCELGFREIDEDLVGVYFMQVGSTLSYFSDLSAESRIAYFNGEPYAWWLRSIATGVGNSNHWAATQIGGGLYAYSGSTVCGIRPAMIMSGETKVVKDTDGTYSIMED